MNEVDDNLPKLIISYGAEESREYGTRFTVEHPLGSSICSTIAQVANNIVKIIKILKLKPTYRNESSQFYSRVESNKVAYRPLVKEEESELIRILEINAANK